jgi:ATP-dependent protease HslVU (ClpYQ) peptidase subunit
MTCIVAVVDGACIVMGSDSAAVQDDTLTVRSESSKSWKHTLDDGETIILGFSGNFAEGLFIRHAFKWPRRKLCQQWDTWLVKEVQPALQQAMKKRFEDRKDVNLEWSLLIGVKPGRIFSLSMCGDVEESSMPFAAIGSGAAAALGCMFALTQSSTTASWDVAYTGLQAAQQQRLAMVAAALLIEAIKNPFPLQPMPLGQSHGGLKQPGEPDRDGGGSESRAGRCGCACGHGSRIPACACGWYLPGCA